MGHSSHGLLRGDEDGVAAVRIVPFAGERLYPALVEAMANPEVYGPYFARADALALARSWPEPVRRALLDAAERSGWAEARTYLAF